MRAIIVEKHSNAKPISTETHIGFRLIFVVIAGGNAYESVSDLRHYHEQLTYGTAQYFDINLFASR